MRPRIRGLPRIFRGREMLKIEHRIPGEDAIYFSYAGTENQARMMLLPNVIVVEHNVIGYYSAVFDRDSQAKTEAIRFIEDVLSRLPLYCFEEDDLAA